MFSSSSGGSAFLRALVIAAVTSTAVASTAGCATTGSNTNGDDTNDTCGAIILAVIAVPCAIAWGTGCVVGGCTACVEHQGQGVPDDSARAAPAEVAPGEGGGDDADGAEVQRVAY